MSSPGILVALTERSWLVVAGGDGGDGRAEVRELARRESGGPLGLEQEKPAELAAMLGSMGLADSQVCLGLPSGMVFCAAVACGDLPRRDRRAAMLYRLEEKLPVEAEQLAAAFLPPRGGVSLALAVETGRLKEIVERLEKAGVVVGAAAPTAVLACQGLIMQGRDRTDSPLAGADHLVFQLDGRAEVFGLRDGPIGDGRLRSWSTVAADPAEVARCLRLDILNLSNVGSPIDLNGPVTDAVDGSDGRRGVAVVAGCLGVKQPMEQSDKQAGEQFGKQFGELAGLLAEDLDVVPVGPSDVTEQDLFRLAVRAGAAMMSGEADGSADLGRGIVSGGLGRKLGRQLAWTAGLAACLMVALTAAMLARARGYQRMADRFQGGQRGIYASLYPNGQVPVSVASRLASDLRRLAGVRGQGGQVPQRPPALGVLRLIAEGLAGGPRMRVTQVRIDPQGVMIEGQATAHGDAEAICRNLAGKGLAMEPPRTENLQAGGVSFVLAGRPAGPAGPVETTAGQPSSSPSRQEAAP